MSICRVLVDSVGLFRARNMSRVRRWWTCVRMKHPHPGIVAIKCALVLLTVFVHISFFLALSTRRRLEWSLPMDGRLVVSFEAGGNQRDADQVVVKIPLVVVLIAA